MPQLVKLTGTKKLNNKHILMSKTCGMLQDAISNFSTMWCSSIVLCAIGLLGCCAAQVVLGEADETYSMESKSLAHSTNMAKSLKLFRSLHFWAIFYYYCQELHTKIEIPRRIFILKNQYRLDRTYTPMFPRIKLCILYTFFGFQQIYVASV